MNQNHEKSSESYPRMMSSGSTMWREAQPSCQVTCPIHQDVRGYIAAIARGEFSEALELIMETNPLPSVCGMICAHPCETKCRRGQVDQPLSIMALKRFVVENAYHSRPQNQGEFKQGQKVAIIGSGPSGLTAAHDLAKMGYRVTIFEREDAAGGALRSAIPKYRLPREVLQRDIERIMAFNVNIETNSELGRNLTISGLKNQDYRAILVSTGLPLSRGLRIPGIELGGILLALPFLREVNLNRQKIQSGVKVIVIGGGNVAIDVARAALRLGAGVVHLVCLEAREEMPSFPWEIEAALAEGVQIHCSKGPKSILGRNGQVTGLECMRCTAVFDAEGRFNPSFSEEEVSVIDGDMIIIAIGQAADLSFLKDSGIRLNERGQLLLDTDTLATSEEGIFASGEVATGPGSAVEAMANGRKAALSIARYLTGKPLAMLPPQETELGELSSQIINKIKKLDRQQMPSLTVEERVQNFAQIELGYNRALAIREARRCLSCGLGTEYIEEECSTCLTCVRICPYGVPIITASGSVDIRVDQCQACGICVNECPAKAVTLKQYQDEEVIQRITTTIANASRSGVRPLMVVFWCSFSAYAIEDFAEFVRIKCPSNIGILTIPCVTKIGIIHLLKAFELGADKVFIVGCPEEYCPYNESTFWARRKVDRAKKILDDVGVGAEQLEMFNLPSVDIEQFEEVLVKITQPTKQMPPDPLNR